MKMHKFAVISLLVAVSLATLSAEEQQKESMLIGPGDLLHVLVFDTPELEQSVRVNDSGAISLILGGSVSVLNCTPPAAAHVIQEALRSGNFVRRPQVTVTVEDYATRGVTVIGEVKNPSYYVINTPRSILDILAMAGGLTDSADRRVAIERRGTGEKVSYFISNSADVAVDSSVTVRPGDRVLVPKAGVVYVLGDVGHPGGYTMTNNDAQLTVLELVARAGGTNHTAMPSRARLIHKNGQTYAEASLPLSDMQKGKKSDLQLQANDIVYVPFSYMRNLASQGSGIAASLATAAVYRF